MKNFISLNGKKLEITDEQLRQLGFPAGNPSIDEVMEIVRSGKAREHFKIHDVLNLGGYDMEIIGFDHDKDSEDESRHTITLMAKTLLQEKRMHSGACKRGWIDTELRKWLNSEFLYTLSEELTQYICGVIKTTHNSEGEEFKTVDRLFCPSESELFGSAIRAAREDGQRYESFATSDDRIRCDEDGDADWYWSRSAFGGYSAGCAHVYNNGSANGYNASYTSIRAPLCFCLS